MSAYRCPQCGAWWAWPSEHRCPPVIVGTNTEIVGINTTFTLPTTNNDVWGMTRRYLDRLEETDPSPAVMRAIKGMRKAIEEEGTT